MVNNLTLSFEHVNTAKTLQMQLTSKFTCINGRDSGEGKSEFLVELEQGMQIGEISCNLGDRFAIADAGSIEALLQLPSRIVIMIDETVAFSSKVLKKMQQSRHLFVCITRAMILHFDYHLKGIYNIRRTDGWFELTRAESLPILNRPLQKDDTLVTESKEFRSEHQMLTEIGCRNLIAACGRDEIEKKLRRSEKPFVVFSDLSAIGRAYRLLLKRCNSNKHVKFYNYESFEQMLCDSSLFKRAAEMSLLDSYSFLTLERYYESLLSEITADTEFKYEHGRLLPKAYAEHWPELLNSDTGKPLLDFMRMQLSDAGNSINSALKDIIAF